MCFSLTNMKIFVDWRNKIVFTLGKHLTEKAILESSISLVKRIIGVITAKGVFKFGSHK